MLGDQGSQVQVGVPALVRDPHGSIADADIDAIRAASRFTDQ